MIFDTNLIFLTNKHVRLAYQRSSATGRSCHTSEAFTMVHKVPQKGSLSHMTVQWGSFDSSELPSSTMRSCDLDFFHLLTRRVPALVAAKSTHGRVNPVLLLILVNSCELLLRVFNCFLNCIISIESANLV